MFDNRPAIEGGPLAGSISATNATLNESMFSQAESTINQLIKKRPMRNVSLNARVAIARYRANNNQYKDEPVH